MKPIIVTNWQDKVVFSSEGPQPQPLVATETLKSVIVGLEPGQKIPAHPAPTSVYHFLDGTGWMTINGERLPIQAGVTVVVPDKALRGIEADTKLSFLGTHSGEK